MHGTRNVKLTFIACLLLTTCVGSIGIILVLGSKKVSACDPKVCRFMKIPLRDYSTMNFDTPLAWADSVHPRRTTFVSDTRNLGCSLFLLLVTV